MSNVEPILTIQTGPKSYVSLLPAVHSESDGDTRYAFVSCERTDHGDVVTNVHIFTGDDLRTRLKPVFEDDCHRVVILE